MARMQHRFRFPLDLAGSDPTPKSPDSVHSLEVAWDNVEQLLRAVETTLLDTFDKCGESVEHWPLTGARGSAEFLTQLRSAALDYFDFIAEQGEWNDAQARFRGEYLAGPLRQLPGISHWSLEKFLWNGSPQLPDHPVDAFLAFASQLYSPAITAEVLGWKRAKLGIVEIGEPTRAGVKLRPWDPVHPPKTSWFEAIELASAEPMPWAESRGCLLAAFIAPALNGSGAKNPSRQSADESAFIMGHTLLVEKRDGASLALLGNLNHSTLGLRSVPWEDSVSVRGVGLQGWHHRWRRRDWRRWLRQHVTGTFPVLIARPGQAAVGTFLSWEANSGLGEASRPGNYAWVELHGRRRLVGATAIVPLNLDSPAADALAEYSAYRRWLGQR